MATSLWMSVKFCKVDGTSVDEAFCLLTFELNGKKRGLTPTKEV